MWGDSWATLTNSHLKQLADDTVKCTMYQLIMMIFLKNSKLVNIGADSNESAH